MSPAKPPGAAAPEPAADAAFDAGPEFGAPAWSFAHGAWRIRFLGVGAPARNQALASRLPRLAPDAVAVAWLHQVHSARVVEARPGSSGDADALVVRHARLAAAVATADCVPIAVVGRAAAAAIHAGWRGIAAGVVPRALERLREEGEGELAAWIGPAIGACCYEVGPDVASAVVAASDESVLAEASGGAASRPRIDLRRAVAVQLAAAGVTAITAVDDCTRCRPDRLWSFRRDRERAGRNLMLVWRVAEAVS